MVTELSVLTISHASVLSEEDIKHWCSGEGCRSTGQAPSLAISLLLTPFRLFPSSPTVQVTQGTRGHSEEGHHSGRPPCQEEILLRLTVASHPQPACPCPRSPSASSPSKLQVMWLLESALGLLCSNTQQGLLWLALV